MGSMAAISIFCFVAAYSAALGLEVWRALRRGVRGAATVLCATLGVLAQAVLLGQRAAAASGVPLSSNQDWYLLAAWMLAVIYLLLIWRRPETNIGLFLLPLVMALVAAAFFLADAQPFAPERARRWAAVHAASLLLATVSVSVGFAAGAMYLRQSFRLRHKRPTSEGLRLPSLEWLERVAGLSALASLALLGLGVISGIVLNVVNVRHHAITHAWNDPFVVTASVMFLGLLSVMLVSAWYVPARRGRRIAYLTLACFALLAIALAAGLLLDTQHGKARWGAADASPPAAREAAP
jgi:ABC-type transport system involved in cytochrome c biogenesis permease subunit